MRFIYFQNAYSVFCGLIPVRIPIVAYNFRENIYWNLMQKLLSISRGVSLQPYKLLFLYIARRRTFL